MGSLGPHIERYREPQPSISQKPSHQAFKDDVGGDQAAQQKLQPRLHEDAVGGEQVKPYTAESPTAHDQPSLVFNVANCLIRNGMEFKHLYILFRPI